VKHPASRPPLEKKQIYKTKKINDSLKNEKYFVNGINLNGESLTWRVGEKNLSGKGSDKN